MDGKSLRPEIKSSSSFSSQKGCVVVAFLAFLAFLFVGFLDLDSLRSLVMVTLVVLFLGKEELILDRSEEGFLVILVEFEDLVEVELSFFNWDVSASFSSGVSLMSLVLFLVEPETESDKESLTFASLVWFLSEPKPEEEEILVNLVWFLEEPVVDLMSLVLFLELVNEFKLDFFLIGREESSMIEMDFFLIG